MIQNELMLQIESYFDVGLIKEIFELEGGYWNQVFKLETEKGEFILRLCNPRTEPESIIFQHRLMRFMHSRIPEVSLPIAGKDGGTFIVHENQVVQLLSFMRGEMTSRKNQDHQTGAAAMLAKLHRAGLEFPENFVLPNYEPLAELNWQENSNWRWSEIKNLLQSGAEELKKRLIIPPIGEAAFGCIEEIIARKTQIEEERGKAKSWIADLKNSNRQLIFAPIHGDYYPGNLLAIENKISAVIDWDVCQSDWLAYELGRALWEFCRYDETAVMNAENVEAFLRAYQKAGGVVPETEFDLLIPFIRVVRVQEILFSLGEALRGEWWDPEYTLYNFTALDNLG